MDFVNSTSPQAKDNGWGYIFRYLVLGFGKVLMVTVLIHLILQSVKALL